MLNASLMTTPMATAPVAPSKKASSPAALSAAARSGAVSANQLARFVNFAQRQPLVLAKRAAISLTAGGISIYGLGGFVNGIKSAFSHGGNEAVTHYVYDGGAQKKISNIRGTIATSAKAIISKVKGGKLQENLPFGFNAKEVYRDAQKYQDTIRLGNTTNGNSLIVPGATSSQRGQVVVQLGTEEECAARAFNNPCGTGSSLGDVSQLSRLDTAPNGDIQQVAIKVPAPTWVTNDPTKGVEHLNIYAFGTPKTVAKIINGVPVYEKSTENAVNYSATFDPNRPNLAFLRNTTFDTPVSNGF